MITRSMSCNWKLLFTWSTFFIRARFDLGNGDVWKHRNVDDDDLRKLEKAFENEVVYVVLVLILCDESGLDCIRSR